MVPWWPVPNACPASISSAMSPGLHGIAVMPAVDKKPARANRLQPFERFRDPVDVRQFLAVDRMAVPFGFEVMPQPRFDRRDIFGVVVGIDRDFMDPGFLVDFQIGEREAVFLEFDLQGAENVGRFALACGQIQSDLRHGVSLLAFLIGQTEVPVRGRAFRPAATWPPFSRKSGSVKGIMRLSKAPGQAGLDRRQQQRVAMGRPAGHADRADKGHSGSNGKPSREASSSRCRRIAIICRWHRIHAS